MQTGGFEQRALEGTLRGAQEELGFTYEQLSATLHVSERTLRRWRYHAHRPQDRHRLRIENLRELLHVLRALFPGDADRQEWLHTPNPHLRGRSPISLIRSGRVGPVLELLATLEAGAFV
jgi:putative toxin-antitoxin system antitoxin component (TIGR02293 family)